MLHPFPTWSFEFADVAQDLESQFRVITPDFLGFGLSDKPRGSFYGISDLADVVEQLLVALEVSSVHLLGLGLGGVVVQELMCRLHRGALPFDLKSVMFMNCSVVFSGLQPSILQRIISVPVLGGVVASVLTKRMFFRALDEVRGDKKLTPEEFEQLWVGISHQDGHKLTYYQLKYNQERGASAERLEHAVFSHDGPLAFIWGLADPVSGDNALRLVTERLDDPTVFEFPSAGHSPQIELPVEVASAIREFVSRHP